jgi:serine/threonine-protein kinase HipA
MSMAGKHDGFTRADFRDAARTVSLKRTRADAILDEVIDAVRRWPAFAQDAGIDESAIDAVARTHRLALAP